MFSNENHQHLPDRSEWLIALGEAAFRFCEHILLPLAIIAMVNAFLFYLLDLRSLYYANTFDLKRIGFCFTTATVLICRYGKVYEDSSRQRFYTGVLAAATFFAMIRDSTNGLEIILNLIIILLVWRFATGVTNSLHLAEEKPGEEYRLYGVERLKMAEALKKARLAQGSLKSEKRKKKDPYVNPARQVLRLAFLAIICFAISEPLILSAPAALSQRAFITVAIFLLGTGIVLAAGSTLGTYRFTMEDQGKASLGMIPGKIFFAITLLVIVLLIVFSLPVIHFQGSGIKNELTRPSDGIVSSQKEIQETGTNKQKGSAQKGKTRQTSPDQPGPQSWFNTLQTIGKILLIPAIIALIIFGLYALFKLRPNLKGLKQKLSERWKNLWQRIKTIFFKQNKDPFIAQISADPKKLLALIPSLPPRDALLVSYQCLLAFFERLGYKRNERLTPFEYLYSIPHSLAALNEPARIITDLYVQAAYARDLQMPDIVTLALKALQQIEHFSLHRSPAN